VESAHKHNMAEDKKDTDDTVEADATAEPAAEAKAPSDVAEPEKKRSGAGLAWTLVAVLAIVAVGLLTLPYWRDSLPPSVRAVLLPGESDEKAFAALKTELATVTAAAKAGADALADLREANETLAATVRQLEGRLEENIAALAALREKQGGPTADPALLARIEKLEQSVAASAGSAAAGESRSAGEIAKLTTAVSTYEERIAGLESSLAESRRTAVAVGKADALALAVGQLRDALAGGAPFAAELSTVQRLAGDNPRLAAALDPVSARAADGIATEAQLFARLPAAIDAALAARPAASKGDWVDRSLGALKRWAGIRRIDGRGEDVEAVVARAEIAARRDDLATAVKELSQLEGAAGPAVGEWLSAARQRLAADAARTEISRIVLSGLAGGG
jgi:hypothetical protein